MNYELYNLIIDLTEAGFTVEFKPFFSDTRPYTPEFIIVIIRTDEMKTSRHVDPSDLLETEDGQIALVTEMINMAKYLIRLGEVKKEREAQEAQP